LLPFVMSISSSNTISPRTLTIESSAFAILCPSGQ